MFNEMIVVAVTPFSGTDSTDKNGENPVMLQLLAGTMPNRNVLSGTVARRIGIEIGKSYLMNVREAGEDLDFGKDYTFTLIKEIDAIEAIRAKQLLGEPKIFTVKRPEGFESAYERKTNAVEGLRSKRAKEGKYIPAQDTLTSYEHKTASVVKEGSSTEDDVDLFPKRESNIKDSGERLNK